LQEQFVPQKASEEGLSSRISELLRVLIYVAEPLRQERDHLSLLDPKLQIGVFERLTAKLEKIEEGLSHVESTVLDESQVVKAIMLYCRCIQFSLGFHATWSPTISLTLAKLRECLFKLVLVCEA
jgi:mediator of RNA polymerase II transcription subunit 12, fungi type